MVSSPNLENCHVTATDVSTAHVILSTDIPGVKGKTVCKSPHRVEMKHLEILCDYYTLQKFVTLTADVMFGNGVSFLTTLSRKIRLVTAEYLPTWAAKQLGSLLTKVVNLYAQRGFTVCTILMDQEFDKVTDLLPNVEVNTTAAHEHIAEIKRMHRTIEEHARGTRAMQQFAHLPKPIVINLIYWTCLWLNAFLVPGGISSWYLPRELVLHR